MFALQITMAVTTLLSHVKKICVFVSAFVNFVTIKLGKMTIRDLLQVMVTLSLLVSRKNSVSTVLYVLVQPKVTSIVQSCIANNDDINHQHIKGQVLMALSLVLKVL